MTDASEFLDGLMSGTEDVKRVLDLNGEQNRVHLANLHKVKGLEAPIVILAQLRQQKRLPAIHMETDGPSQKRWVLRLTGPSFNSAVYAVTARFKDELSNNWTLVLNFADTEIAYKIVEGCVKENHISECVSEVEKFCRTDLLAKLNSSIHECLEANDGGKYELVYAMNSAKKELSSISIHYADNVGYEKMTIEFQGYGDRTWFHFDLYDYELNGVTLIDLQMNSDW